MHIQSLISLGRAGKERPSLPGEQLPANVDYADLGGSIIRSCFIPNPINGYEPRIAVMN